MVAAGHRMATATLESAGRLLWGFRPTLMRAIVDQEGPGGALWWFATNMPRYERTRSALGPVRAHLLCAMVSVLGGCRYCTHGHAYALQLCYLDEHGSLFPLDEAEIVGLMRLGEDEAVARMERALHDAGLPDEVDAVHRLVELRSGAASPSGREDRRLKHLVDMFGLLNSCGVQSGTPPDEAHDPINKDASVKDRYAELRRAAAAQS